MASETIAALDLGSNTFRLMLAEKRGNLWGGKRVFQRIPRLSQSLESGGKFAPEALSRAWEALEDLAALVDESGAEKILAGATMAARLAADGPELMAAVSQKYGWEAHILSGRDEARLTATGVLTALAPLPEQSLIFDIGGRSTEFISAAGSALQKSRSLSLGVVLLTEKHLSDPIRPGQLEVLSREVRAILAAADFSDVSPSARLVGTAGTVTTIAALLLGLKEYQPELVNNSIITKDQISDLTSALAAETVAERVERHGLHPRRADAIVAGLLMTLEIMDFFQSRELMVSDNGLLEALWLTAAGLLPPIGQ